MKRKIHDGIVGALIAGGVGLSYWMSPAWLLLPGILALTMVQSAFTGFCPVYFTLDKLMGRESKEQVAHGA